MLYLTKRGLSTKRHVDNDMSYRKRKKRAYNRAKEKSLLSDC